ncbi:MATE family efflux transporter [Marivibrio halodurans]|uniref:MATE family efflux transporter n=1 Tax=Marivibrio halodurans TaxID=2039722 RepID=A0A8J7V3A5_9PROT|nr:MATE family efflux transporter [Marivibrio halodurans]MBP5858026.1 MATE family efflux transporter [Marivibrio halodurans]
MSRWLLDRFTRHSSELVRLAAPVIVSRAGALMLTTVDIAMLGRVSAEAVGHYTLGTSPFIILMVIGIGLQQGVLVATSQHRGRERWGETGQVWRRGLPYAVLCGLVGFALTTQGDHYFALTGQDLDLIGPSASVTFWQGLGLVPMMLYIATAFFLEGLGRPVPVLVAIWGANLLNLVLNLWLIEGGLGLPALGADGAAIATTVARAAMAGALILYVWRLSDHGALGVRLRPNPGWFSGGRRDRRYGYAAGLSLGFETGAFGVLALFAGWLGPQALAVYGIANALLAMLFMAALGIATATGVRVGVAHGRGDGPDRALAGWVGFAWTMLAMGLFAVILHVLPGEVAAIYTNDPFLAVASVPAILLVGWLVCADGGQVLVANALRAADDPWVPSIMAFFSYFVVMIPLGWYLGIRLERGVEGLYEGILIASVINAAILTLRWGWISLRGVRAAPPPLTGGPPTRH